MEKFGSRMQAFVSLYGWKINLITDSKIDAHNKSNNFADQVMVIKTRSNVEIENHFITIFTVIYRMHAISCSLIDE